MPMKKITEEQLKYIYGDDWDFFTSKILNNVNCACTDRYGATIVDYEIFLDDNDFNDIVLKGKCAKCGGPVNRYLETGEVEEYADRIEVVKNNRIIITPP